MTEEDRQRLIEYLEADQLVSDTSRPVPRARPSRPAKAALWALRVFALIMSLLVIYTFAAQLH
jgi:hypothetical protein